MDPRTRSKIDPKFRQIGFVYSPQNPNSDPHPSTSAISGTGVSSPPAGVMIPPSRLSVPVPATRRPLSGDVAGSFNPTDSVLAGDSDNSGDAEVSEDWVRTRSSSGKYSIGFNMSGINSPVAVAGAAEEVGLSFDDGAGTRISEATMPNKVIMEASKPLKERTSKAERRALQEAQRAAKASGKAEASGSVALRSVKPTKLPKQPPPKKDALSSSMGVSEFKGADRPSEKDKKKDVPPPRMQYDDKSRVEKAKKHSVVNQTEARNRVELFLHLPQYEFGSQLQDLESKFFKLDSLHPAVYQVGVQYLAGNVTGSNARCISMLHAFREAIEDYHTPPDKELNRDLNARISSYVSFLNECRPLSISMGNAIRPLKTQITNVSSNVSDSDAKTIICSHIDQYIREKIIIADKVIVGNAVTKISDGDILLTYGASSIIEMVLVRAHELGKKFRVVVVDSRPKLEGQALLRRLVMKGLSCSYTHINAVSYVMHEVTRVFLGAASIFSNGTVYSRIGTASVAMVAHAFRIPVLVCCEAYKFSERVSLDSICVNELGDPNAITRIPGRKSICYLDNNCRNTGNLRLLNLLYDVTPADFVSSIITDYGMVPPTSVPVIVRQYRKEHLF